VGLSIAKGSQLGGKGVSPLLISKKEVRRSSLLEDNGEIEVKCRKMVGGK